MREEDYKIVEARVTKRRDRVQFMCAEDAAGMVRIGYVTFPRLVTAREAERLQLRLRNRRLSELEPILLEILRVKVERRLDFGDVTPQDS